MSPDRIGVDGRLNIKMHVFSYENALVWTYINQCIGFILRHSVDELTKTKKLFELFLIYLTKYSQV